MQYFDFLPNWNKGIIIIKENHKEVALKEGHDIFFETRVLKQLVFGNSEFRRDMEKSSNMSPQISLINLIYFALN